MIAEELAKWVLDRLREQRYQLISAITPFRLQPWSQVYRVASTKGWIYVKQIAEPFVSVRCKAPSFMSMVNL